MALSDRADTPAGAERAPVAIEVRDLKKAFKIPVQRIDTLKERVAHPFSRSEFRNLQALDGISFEIHKGEFFGIVGRNGSGKSTLLKLLASIYQADAGSIRMTGRLAPFIELGVGFNVDLTARENVVLNGVMMGLTPTEAKGRLDAVLEFAELEDFVDLKLKNYSSGMLVRLAFSVMLQADADVMLIDEVLAVGDAAFQQKCADAFHEMKNSGKTIVLVTHEMSTVEGFCDRAMLIEGGEIQHLGDPAEVGRRYLRANFERGTAAEEVPVDLAQGETVRVVDAWLTNDDGEKSDSVEHGSELDLRVELELKQDLPGLDVGFVLANADGIGVFQFGEPIRVAEGEGVISAGQRLQVKAKIENPLAPGRYFVHLGVNRASSADSLLYVHNCIDFVVFGGHVQGIVALNHEIATEFESRDG